MTEPAIECVHLTKAYKVFHYGFTSTELYRFLYQIFSRARARKSFVKALDDVSLSIRRGEIFGLLGPNGSGKTTLLNILGGVVVPTSGEARILGYDVVRDHDEAVKHVNYVKGALTGGALISTSMTARENLEILSSLLGLDRSQIDEVLSFVGLQDRADTAVATYSSGLYARLVLATNILKQRPIFLMDEPLAGMSRELVLDLSKYLLKLREAGVTVVYATHDLEIAQEICDRVALLHKGRVVALGTPSELARSLGEEEVVRMELRRIGRGVAGMMEKIDYVSHVAVEGEDGAAGLLRLRVLTKDSRECLPALIDIVVKEGGRVRFMEVLKPSLEDVYLHYIKGDGHG